MAGVDRWVRNSKSATSRQSPRDVIVLAADLLEQAARRLNLAVPRLTAENIRELCSYDWPGNVRELQNVLERALIVSGGGRLHFALGDSNPATAKLTEATSPVRYARPNSLNWSGNRSCQLSRKQTEKSTDWMALQNCWGCARPRFRQRSRPSESAGDRRSRFSARAEALQ